MHPIYLIHIKFDTDFITALFDFIYNTNIIIFIMFHYLVIFDLKSTEELSFMTLESDSKFDKKLTSSLENNMENLVNFYQSTWKSQNLDLDGILLSKVENIWA